MRGDAALRLLQAKERTAEQTLIRMKVKLHAFIFGGFIPEKSWGTKRRPCREFRPTEPSQKGPLTDAAASRRRGLLMSKFPFSPTQRKQEGLPGTRGLWADSVLHWRR